MPVWILLILLPLIQQSLSLHMLQTLIYNQQKYLSALQELQSKFKTDFDKIKINLQNFKKELALTQGNDKARLKLLKKGLAHERDELLALQSYVKLPYGLKSCKCKGFTEDLKSATTSNLQQLSNSLQKLKDGLVSWPNCRITRQLKSQILKQQQYTSIIKDIGNSPCHRPPKSFLPDEPSGLINLNESQYISNLEGTKWIYGSITPGDYKYRIFSLTTKTNLTKCPIQKPFTRDGRKCIACPDNNPLWSVGNFICTTCGVGEHYNPYAHNCSIGNILEEEKLEKIQGAEKGQPATGMNRNRHGSNYINNPPENDPDLKTCSVNEPFFDGKKCTVCRLPQVFNFDTLSCEDCPSGTTYNIKRKICSSSLASKFVTNFNARNLVVGGDQPLSSLQRIQRQKLRQNPELQICSLTSPYFDGQICTSCSTNKPYFNLQSQQCENCDKGYSYFQSVSNCTVNIYVTNSLAKGIIQTDNHTFASIYQQASALKASNPNNRLEMCPISQPFANKNFVCISCPQESSLFNLKTRECSRCSDQTFYDQQLSKCIGKYITNPNSPNLYFKGVSKQDYVKEYNSLKRKYQELLDCPVDSPYWNGVNCVSCAQSTPIFSLSTKMCGQCPVGKVYDQRTGDCVGEQEQ